MTEITVYTNPNCGPCAATKTLLDREGLSFTEVDASTNPEACELLRDLGYQTAPVVIVEQGGEVVDHWWGFRATKIRGLST